MTLVCKIQLFLIFIVLAVCAPAPSLWAATAEDYYKDGMAQYQAGQYDKAVQNLKAAVQLNPQSWQAYQMLGTCYYQLHQNDEAIAACNKSLQLHPDNPSLKKFVDALQPLPVSSPQNPSNVNSKKKIPASMAEHLFLRIGFGLGPDFTDDFNNSINGLKQAFSDEMTSGRMLSFNIAAEAGYCLDEHNAISFSIEGCGYHDPGISYNSITTPNYAFNEMLENKVMRLGLNYYYFLPDSDGRWFGVISPQLYRLDFEYSQSYIDSSQGINESISMYSNQGGFLYTLGGTAGVGRQFDLGGVSLEMGLKFRYAQFSPIIMPYKVSGSSNPYFISGSSGKGVLVATPSGAIAVIDQSVYNSSMGRYATYSFTGVESDIALDIWF